MFYDAHASPVPAVVHRILVCRSVGWSGVREMDPSAETPAPTTQSEKPEQEPEKKVSEVKVEKKVISDKVEVSLQAAGDAPIMKQKKYMVGIGRLVGWVLI